MRSAVVVAGCVGLCTWTHAAQGPTEATKKLIAQFVRELENAKDAVNRGRAAQALGANGAAAKEALPALRQALKNDPDASVREEAALALFRIAPSPDLPAEVFRAVEKHGRSKERELARTLKGTE